MEKEQRKIICEKIADLTSEVAEFIKEERKVFTRDKIEYKGHNNMVSYVDKTSEAKIIQGLKEILPQSDFIAEEGQYAKNNYPYRWIIDPLDGTTNFIHGFAPYCISIALQENEKTIIGVIREITRGDIYTAYGEGAFLNGQPIHVSKVNSIEDSLVITGLAYSIKGIPEKDLSNLYSHFNKNSHGTRRTGSAAMNLAYIAKGDADIFYQLNLSPWDVAAGAFLIEQAGGKVTDFNGNSDYIFGRSIIASNQQIFNEVFKTISQF